MPINKDARRLTCSLILSLLLSLVLGTNVSYANTICKTYLVEQIDLVTPSHLKTQGVLLLDGHRQMFYQTFNILNPEQPTLVFFPGIYSALVQDSDFFKYLESKNIPYVNFHFSSHPKSISTLDPESDLPNFTHLTSQELAIEVMQLMEYLNLKSPVAVTTSYSSTLINHFPKDIFSKVIDTAPIGRLHEDHELQFYFANLWSSILSLNPATLWLNTHIQRQNHYNYWNAHVKLLMGEYQGLKNPSLNDLATKAYIAMIKAVEKYDIRDVDFVAGPERIFILAADEGRRRLQLQLDAIKNAEQQLGYKLEVHKIEGADHIVAYSQPQAYADLLIQILESL